MPWLRPGTLCFRCTLSFLWERIWTNLYWRSLHHGILLPVLYDLYDWGRYPYLRQHFSLRVVQLTADSIRKELRMRKWNSSLPFVIVLLLPSCVATAAFGQTRRLSVDETVQTLRTIVEKQRANFERISTWEGEYSCHDRTTLDRERDKELRTRLGITSDTKEIIQESHVTISFAFDRRAKKLFNSVIGPTPRFLAEDNGSAVRVRGVHSVDSVHVLTPEHYIYSLPVEIKAKAVRSARGAWVVPAADARQRAGVQFIDPRGLFSFDTARPHWEVVSQFHQEPQYIEPPAGFATSRPSGPTFYVEDLSGSDGQKWRLVAVGPAPEVMNLELVFDEAAGHNVTFARQGHNGATSAEMAVSYSKQEGIFIPNTLTRTYYDEVGRVRLVHELTLGRSVLNAGVPPEKFGMRSLKLSEGEKIHDQIRNTEYVYSASLPDSLPASP